MRENDKTNIIYVLSVGMDERKDAILRAAFRMHTREQYSLANGTAGIEPSLAIVDIDGPQGISVWHEFRESNPVMPAILVSVAAPTFAIDAPFLNKPIRVETLFPALRALLPAVTCAENPNKFQNKITVPIPKQATNSIDKKDEIQSVIKAAERPVDQLVEVDSSVKQVPSHAFLNTFNPNIGLLGKVRAAVKAQGNVAILYEGKPIMLILPKDNMVLMLEPLDKLRLLCVMKSGEFESKLIPLGKVLPAVVNIKLMNLMWQLGIWTAQGRLIHPLTPDTRLVLRCWPNFTRVALIPDAMRVAAFLSRTPVNLHILFKVLRVDVKNLANFLAAAYVTGFLVVPEDEGTRSRESGVGELGMEVSTKHVDKEAEALFKRDSKPRSVLQRLLKKLSS